EAGQACQDAREVGLLHRLQGLQVARDLIAYGRDGGLTQRGKSRIRRLQGHHRRGEITLEDQTPMCELQQEQGLCSRPRALRSLGSATQLLDAHSQLLELRTNIFDGGELAFDFAPCALL